MWAWVVKLTKWQDCPKCSKTTFACRTSLISLGILGCYPGKFVIRRSVKKVVRESCLKVFGFNGMFSQCKAKAKNITTKVIAWHSELLAVSDLFKKLVAFTLQT